MSDTQNTNNIKQEKKRQNAENQPAEETAVLREEIKVEERIVVEERKSKAEDLIEAGELPPLDEDKEPEEVQQLHTKHPRKEVATIDHRLLAGKLNVYDWLDDLPKINTIPRIVEVRFKNTRKGFYTNPSRIPLKAGDIVAVEAALGHDIGVVSLTGELVKEQLRLKHIDIERNPLKKVYRKAKPNDIEKWQQAIALEHDTMIRARKIAADLRLNMKIGDVEYQGDKTKAIFYYIADDRVDFRTLIKVLAETFHIRIEMRQIGSRQEAGRIGGIGPCGRKLCCSTFITNFVSVSTSAARYQDISLNPQKLAGQCGKLKCCLNFEVDAYVDAQKDFPSASVTLNTGEGLLYHQKTDIFGRTMSYSTDKEGRGMFIELSVDRVKDIIAQNRKGIIPPRAKESNGTMQEDIKYTDGVGEESLNRFDDKLASKRRKKNKNKRSGNAKPAENAKPAATGKPAANAPSPAKPAPKPAQPANRNANPQGQPRKQNGNRQPNKPKPKNPQPQTPKTEQ